MPSIVLETVLGFFMRRPVPEKDTAKAVHGSRGGQGKFSRLDYMKYTDSGGTKDGMEFVIFL